MYLLEAEHHSQDITINQILMSDQCVPLSDRNALVLSSDDGPLAATYI